MKPCIMSLAYLQEPGTTLRGMFEFAQSLGIDGIDFCQTHMLNASIGELKKMCRDYGIAAVCHTVFNDPAAPGMTRQKWLDNAQRIIEDAATLETGKVMFPTSGKPGIARRENRRKWLELLAETVTMGAKCGIAVSIESYVVDVTWSPFITSDDLLRAVQEVPGLKVTFDSGNHFIVEDVMTAYRKLAPFVVHVHLKDWEILPKQAEKSLLMGDGQYYRMVPFGKGLVNNAACLQAMLDDGAEYYFDLEYSGVEAAPAAIGECWEYLQKHCHDGSRKPTNKQSITEK